MNRILVITVTYNGMKWIDRCIGSLRQSSVPADVFVVDNASSDNTVEYLREHYPEVIVHETGANIGFGKANNIGFQHAVEKGYDYVYLLNQDAWVMHDTFSRLLEAMEEHPEYGILSPVQMTASLDKEDRNFREKCLSSGKRYEDGLIYDVGFVMAAHWMMSRKCVVTVGGFSPAFPHYGEDDNYIHRALYHGFKVGFLMGVHAVHDRESRPYVKETAMKRKLVIAKTKVSDPRRCLVFSMIFQPLEMAAVALYHMSWTVFLSIFSLIRAYPVLAAYRRQSKGAGAFI